MSYKKEIDYQAKINDAVSVGDYKSAAQYEKSRNEKIDNENLSYKKTNDYAGWLDKTDYSDVLRGQIASGANKKEVSDTLKKRVKKASETKGMEKYAYDNVYDKAVSYIMGNNSYSFEPERPRYKDSYGKEIKNIYNQLSRLKEFSYDAYNDDLYSYYKEQYNREGKRAMEDILGELSMNTGGMPSSYAVSAASQALDYYNTKLTDKIPQLYSYAYERYKDDIGLRQKNIDILSKLGNEEYDRYIRELEQYNNEKDSAYKNYSDLLKHEISEKEIAEREEKERLNYDYLIKKLYSEMTENDRKHAQTEYENDMKLKQQEYENRSKEEQKRIENALKKWNQMGYLDKESADILGLEVGQRTGDYDYKMKNLYK